MLLGTAHGSFRMKLVTALVVLVYDSTIISRFQVDISQYRITQFNTEATVSLSCRLCNNSLS